MLKFGVNNIGRAILGSTEIGKAYLGSNLVFSKGIAPDIQKSKFIYSVDGAYINTGIIPDQSTRVVCDFHQIQPSYQNWTFLFGSRTSFESNDFTFTAQRWSSNAANGRATLRNTSFQFGGLDDIRRDKCRVDFNNNGVVTIYNLERGTTVASHDFGTVAEFSSPGPLYICVMNDNGSSWGDTYFQLYEIWIYQSDELVMHLVPRDEGGIGFMYDTVSGQSFYSADENHPFLPSDDFDVEPAIEKVSLPSGYAQLKYLYMTSGIGTPIKTGFSPDQDTKVVVDILTGNSNAWSHLFGSRIAYTNNDYTFTIGNNSSTTMRCVYGNEDYTASYAWKDKRLLITMDKNHIKVVDRISGETVMENTFTTQTVTPGKELYYFTYNNNGASGNNCTIYSATYSVKIYDNGTLVRDYVPAKRKSDDKAGFYDLVNDSFVTGSVYGGPEI